MTALAMRAISMSLSVLRYSVDEIKKLEEAIFLGFEYLKSTLSLSKDKAYWSFNYVPSCAATVWALLALKQISTNDGTNSDVYKEFYDENKNKCLSFILSKIPAKSLKWEDEPIVYEGGAKYNKQKNYFSYSATLIPQLISLGVSPYNPKIINQIKWLINNPDKWKISGYDKNTTCSFTYAMIISLLADWVSKVGSENAVYLITSSKSKINNFVRFVTGMPLVKGNPVQMVLKSRLIIFFVMTVLFIVIIVWGADINEIIHKMAAKIVSLWTQSSGDRRTILVNVISNSIYAIILLVLGFLCKFFKNHFWKR